LKYKVKEEIFDSLEDAVAYCEENDIPLDNIEIVKEDEEEVVIPDENSAMTHLDILRTKKDKGVEPIHYTNQPKKYDEQLKTNTVFREYYLRGYEALCDSRLVSCPFCQVAWSNLSEDLKENLFTEQHKELEGKIPLRRLLHCKQKHVPVYDFLVSIGVVQQFKKIKEDGDTTLKPVSEEGVQSLSNEQLAIKLKENPESLKAFYRKWIQSLRSK